MNTEADVDADESPQEYVRSCAGYVYFADQGIEVCETCGGCTCCDHADVDHRNARYRCFFDREGMKCLLVGSKTEHDCARDAFHEEEVSPS